jgi:hypothetical protein
MKHLPRMVVSSVLASFALVAATPAFASSVQSASPQCGGDKHETPKPDPKPQPKPPSAL